MLVLTRRQGESVRIGADVRVTVVAAHGGQVRIAIDAPADVGIFREEIFERVATANVEAASVSGALLERFGGAGAANGMQGEAEHE